MALRGVKVLEMAGLAPVPMVRAGSCRTTQTEVVTFVITNLY